MFQKVKHIVVDSGAFIKNAAVQEYAENIYSVNGVVTEIRDKATRQRLQVLPYTLQLKDPEPENFKYVAEFSKKTGDYSSLSATDLKVIALTYQLEKQLVGTDHLNIEPSCEVTSRRFNTQQPLLGFYYPENDEDDVTNDEGFSEKSSISEDCHNAGILHKNSQPENERFDIDDSIENASSKENVTSECVNDNDVDCQKESTADCNKENFGDCDKENIEDCNKENVEDCNKENVVEYNRENGKASDEENVSDEEEEICCVQENDDSWITPDNLAEVQKQMGNLDLDSTSDTEVACITTDFAIQNVLLQMGLNVISVNGMRIKHAKVFILRCFACYRTTSIMTSKFCPNCGNKTLKRVAVSVNDDGTKTIHVNFRRPINIRGTKYSLPKPQGGKHGLNPHLCPDQQFPHNRPSKAALKKVDVLSADYNETSSPFSVHDIYSRAAILGIHSSQHEYDRGNPNAWGKRTGNKKNKKR